jgi:hypothetical protein
MKARVIYDAESNNRVFFFEVDPAVTDYELELHVRKLAKEGDATCKEILAMGVTWVSTLVDRSDLSQRLFEVLPGVSRCSVCKLPAHASETDDDDVCVTCSSCMHCGHPVPAEGFSVDPDEDYDRTGDKRPRCSSAACVSKAQRDGGRP